MSVSPQNSYVEINPPKNGVKRSGLCALPPGGISAFTRKPAKPPSPSATWVTVKRWPAVSRSLPDPEPASVLVLGLLTSRTVKNTFLMLSAPPPAVVFCYGSHGMLVCCPRDDVQLVSLKYITASLWPSLRVEGTHWLQELRICDVQLKAFFCFQSLTSHSTKKAEMLKRIPN